MINITYSLEFNDIERLDNLSVDDFKKLVLTNLYHQKRIFDVHVIAEQFKEENTKLREEKKEKDQEYYEFKNFQSIRNKFKFHADYFSPNQ